MNTPRVSRYLVLSDGTTYQGQPLGAEGTTIGEVVFNTGMTGYQEILSDPSYSGQIVLFTYPLIGNYGINSVDPESSRVQVAGFVIREAPPRFSNWRAESSLEEYLDKAGITALTGVDTRALTLHLRSELRFTPKS